MKNNYLKLIVLYSIFLYVIKIFIFKSGVFYEDILCCFFLSIFLVALFSSAINLIYKTDLFKVLENDFNRYEIYNFITKSNIDIEDLEKELLGHILLNKLYIDDTSVSDEIHFENDKKIKEYCNKLLTKIEEIKSRERVNI